MMDALEEPDDKLVQNLEKQLERLVEQISDLEECKNEMSSDEYGLIKEDTNEQIKDFENSLEKLQKGNMTLNTKLSDMKVAIKAAIARSFNTHDLKQVFETHEDLDSQLRKLEETFQLKKIDEQEFCTSKIHILQQLQNMGRPITEKDLEYLRKQDQMQFLEEIEDG